MRKTLLLTAPFILLSCTVKTLAASPLEITIRGHANKVTFGDPIYLEFSIVNSGKEPITATNPVIEAGYCQFMARELKTNLQVNCTGPEFGAAGFGGSDKIEYLPGKPVKQRWRIFAPYCYELDHPFWKAAQESGKVQIWFVLALEKKVSLRSDPITVQLEPRDQDELKALQKWSIRTNQQPETSISPMNFGLNLSAVNTKQTAKRVAEQIVSGELGELLRLVVQIQEIRDSPESRQAGASALLNWLRGQPDIKQQVLCDRIGQMYPWLPAEVLRSIKDIAESNP